jgi:hypothetical protein
MPLAQTEPCLEKSGGLQPLLSHAVTLTNASQKQPSARHSAVPPVHISPNRCFVVAVLLAVAHHDE